MSRRARALSDTPLLRRRNIAVAKDVHAAVQVQPNPPFQRPLLERRQVDVRASRADTLEGHRPKCAELHDGGFVLRDLPPELHPVLPFDLELLPDALRPWISDVCERVQCPPDFVAVPVMVALGSLIGRKVRIRPKARDSWTVVPNVWGCIIGRLAR